MKKTISRLLTCLIAVLMMLSFSACSAEDNVYIDFLLNGWDGIFEQKEDVERVWPDPTVKVHKIREDHKVTGVNNVVDMGSKGNGYTIAGTDGVEE